MKIRLLIVDDHHIFIDAMKALFRDVEDIEVQNGVTTADDAIAAAHQLKPDIILMDIQMPNKNGIEATREILKANPLIKIIALTSANESIYIKKMLEAGASGYVLKNIDKEKLIHAINKVYQGEKYLDQDVTNQLITNFESKAGSSTSLMERLTKREKEVLTLIAQGLTDKEIASQVFLSPQTIITHRKNILSKLELKNKVELTRFAIDNHLI